MASSMTTPRETWNRKDAGRGALFLVAGLLMITLAVLTSRNGWPILLFGPAYLLGAILTLLGGHAVFRGIRGR